MVKWFVVVNMHGQSSTDEHQYSGWPSVYQRKTTLMLYNLLWNHTCWSLFDRYGKIKRIQHNNRFMSWHSHNTLTPDQRDNHHAIYQELLHYTMRMKLYEENFNWRTNIGLWIWCGDKNAVFIMGYWYLETKKPFQVKLNVIESFVIWWLFDIDGVVYQEFLTHW